MSNTISSFNKVKPISAFNQVKTISSFNQVKLCKSNTLVLCDIDNTILHFPKRDKFCEEIMNDFYPNYINKPNGINNTNYMTDLQNLKEMYALIKEPNHTDYNGFVSMVKTLKETNGKLMFLTARHLDSDKWTKKQLNKIGINIEDFDFHYTGTIISKGEYIKQNICLTEWTNIIFIDDYEQYIKSVIDIFPEITCYKFQVKTHI